MRSLPNLIFGTIATLMLVLVSFAPLAQEQQERPVLRVGYAEEEPYSFTDPNGQVRGYSIDIIVKLARSRGFDVAFVPVNTRAELLKALSDRAIDVTPLLAITEARREFGKFTHAIGHFETSLIVRSDSSVRGVQDLVGMRIGAVGGTSASLAVGEVPFATGVEFRTTAETLFALLGGSVDAIAAPSESMLVELGRLGIRDRVRVLKPGIVSHERAFLVAPGRPDLLAHLNQSIERELTPVNLKLLHYRWFGHDIGNGLAPWVMIAVGGMISAVLGFGLHGYFGRKYRVQDKDQKGQLLLGTLNQIDLSVIVFDTSLAPVFWNDATARAFPGVVSGLRRGDRLPAMLGIAEPDADGSHEPGALIAAIRKGKDTSRVMRMEDGRVFEAAEIGIGDGHIAVLRKDITETHTRQDRLSTRNAELAQALDRMKQFSEIAAHDLCAPLRQQTALMDIIQEDLEDEDRMGNRQVAGHVRLAQDALMRMSRLIEGLLDYARNGNGSATVTPVILGERITELRKIVEVPPGFALSLTGENLELEVSEAALDLVLRNLVSNAIKHHDQDTGGVLVTARKREDHAEITVRDDGPGVPEEYRARIFLPFERLEKSGSTEGSGLGLALVARTVEGWGGRITVHSAPGRGSLFRFTVPLPGTQMAPARQDADGDKIVELRRTARG